MIENLPLGSYVIGDNAYVCTEHLLMPFTGEQQHFPKNNTFNYLLVKNPDQDDLWTFYKLILAVLATSSGQVEKCR